MFVVGGVKHAGAMWDPGLGFSIGGALSSVGRTLGKAAVYPITAPTRAVIKGVSALTPSFAKPAFNVLGRIAAAPTNIFDKSSSAPAPTPGGTGTGWFKGLTNLNETIMRDAGMPLMMKGTGKPFVGITRVSPYDPSLPPPPGGYAPAIAPTPPTPTQQAAQALVNNPPPAMQQGSLTSSGGGGGGGGSTDMGPTAPPSDSTLDTALPQPTGWAALSGTQQIMIVGGGAVALFIAYRMLRRH